MVVSTESPLLFKIVTFHGVNVMLENVILSFLAQAQNQAFWSSLALLEMIVSVWRASTGISSNSVNKFEYKYNCKYKYKYTCNDKCI